MKHKILHLRRKTFACVVREKIFFPFCYKKRMNKAVYSRNHHQKKIPNMIHTKLLLEFIIAGYWRHFLSEKICRTKLFKIKDVLTQFYKCWHTVKNVNKTRMKLFADLINPYLCRILGKMMSHFEFDGINSPSRCTRWWCNNKQKCTIAECSLLSLVLRMCCLRFPKENFKFWFV